ncbi:tyrosine-type recombinase/integrase [Ktedonobacter sp. SOSP1-85]|uniref:tyrosine-type recombinase/integrase n=1 Tax=Ktedonobacter sp. SOSP1-85 TaxID=2778367 RepID=UPI001F4444EF|nr:tyrosine-type recombinase/integrase [Ktedonobacter sp. SOSP1-85]
MTEPKKRARGPQTRNLVRVFTRNELYSLQEAAEKEGIGLLFLVALSTGLRRGELLGLHWQDLEMETRALSIHRSVSLFPKSDFLERECAPLHQRAIKLPALLVQHLQRHQQVQHEVRQQAGEEWEERGLVFPNERGNYLSPYRLSQCFQQALEEANLPSTPFHAVRNTTISLLLMLGAEPRVVQSMLGVSWRDTSTISIAPITLDHYENAIQRILDFLHNEGEKE